MLFEDFEGYKKIKNTMNLDINQIFNLLMKYEKEIGTITLDENNIIFINIENSTIVKLCIENSNIIIERKIKSDGVQFYEKSFEEGKNLDIAKADRMIEQIYDLINDYIENNGEVSEHITSSKKVVYMQEEERYVLGGLISLGNMFKIKDENGKEIYAAIQKKFNNIYVLKNLQTKLEEFSINYEELNSGKFSIIKPPFNKLDFVEDKETTKTSLKCKNLKDTFEISGDYTDNHYLIEENEIVIGSIDCLDPLVKNKYKIEINNLEKETLIIAIGIMMDIYNFNKSNN